MTAPPTASPTAPPAQRPWEDVVEGEQWPENSAGIPVGPGAIVATLPTASSTDEPPGPGTQTA